MADKTECEITKAALELIKTFPKERLEAEAFIKSETARLKKEVSEADEDGEAKVFHDLDVFFKAVEIKQERLAKLEKLANISLAPKGESKGAVEEAVTINEAEKLHPYKRNLRVLKEKLVAGGSSEQAINAMNLRYAAVIKSGEMTVEGAVMMHVCFAGNDEEKATMMKLLMTGKVKEAVAEVNVRYLANLEATNPAKALSLGNKIVACPYPMLYESIPQAIASNESMLEDVVVELAPLSGGGVEPKLVSLKMGLNGVFRVGGMTKLVNISKNLMEMMKKTPMLAGGGFSYQLNEDGALSIEEVERYLTDLTAQYTALRERLDRYESEAGQRM